MGRRASATVRPRHPQTAEGELRIDIPQVREAAETFISKPFPKWHCKRLLRIDPLKAMIIGAFVRGLSMREVEALCQEAGLGKVVKVDGGHGPREPARALGGVKRHDLYDIKLVVLFLDAIYLAVRPGGP